MRRKLALVFFIILVLPFSSPFIFKPLSFIGSLLGINGPNTYKNPIPTIPSTPIKVPNQQPKPQPPKELPELLKIFRTIDGSNNNLKNPNLGKSHTNMPRLTKAAYADGKGEMIDRGNPRVLSNTIGSFAKNEEVIQNKLGLNMLFVLFGQFMDHDMDLTLFSGTQKAQIKVPKGDPFFDKNSQGNKKIEFSRSNFVLFNGVRTMANELTSYIDGSQVYGSDESTTKNLRSFQQGKLKLQNNMLIKDQSGAFVAGDLRVNENIGLTAIQTIFARQHNRQCDLLLKKYPHLDDEQLFRTARNKIIGFIQKIALKDYLPLLLGSSAYNKYVGTYKGYNNQVDPSVNLQFSTAAYRIGHPLLYKQITLFNYDNNQIKTISMEDMFLSFKTIKSPQQIDFIMNGMVRTQAKQRNNQIVDGLRNLLVQFEGFVQDLFALNVQRGRDHGIPDYNTVRRSLGLQSVKSFKEISSNFTTVSRLQRAYGNTSNIDLWVGIISQDSLKGGNLGEVGAAIVGETFKRVRDGDRLWYKSAYPKNQIEEIERTTLVDIILRNTKLSDIQSGFKTPDFDPNSIVTQRNNPYGRN